MGVWALTLALLPELSVEGAGKNTHLPVFPWMEFDCIRYNLLSESLASN